MGQKILFTDPTTHSLLIKSISEEELAEMGVINIYNQISKHWNELKNTECKNIMFLIQPNIQTLNVIIPIIEKLKKLKTQIKSVYFVFVPQRNILVMSHIQTNIKILSNVTILDFCFGLIPINKDVLSLELEYSFQSLYLSKDYDV